MNSTSRETLILRYLGRVVTNALPYLILSGAALFVSWGSITRRDIDGLDEAHHIMDGIFFADLAADLPFDRLARYPFDYYRQYPALGFTFWPPFYALIEGIFLRACGIDLIATRICMLFFVILFSICLYRLCKSSAGSALALLGVCLVLTTPLMADSSNRVMLEIPALAMAFLTVILYRRLVERGHWTGWGEVCLLALVAAAAVYTKQTIIFLFPAILVDLCLNRRQLLKSPDTWASAGLLILLCIPLLLFTLKYGGVNLAQSFGGKGDIYVAGHGGSSRWTIAGWIYYVRQFPSLINPILCILGAAALVYGIARSAFLRSNALLVGWIVSWYVLFSLMDNKQPRFVTFAAPAIVLLAIDFVAATTKGRPRARALCCSGFLVLLSVQAVTVATVSRSGYSGIDRVVANLIDEGRPNNIAYVGRFRQMVVPWVRILDRTREVRVLQGDDIARVSPDFADACRDFQIKWILLEDPTEGGAAVDRLIRQLEGPPFELVRRETFGPGGSGVALGTYRYLGPIAESARMVPLRSEVQGIAD